MTATLHVLAIGLQRPLRIADCAYILGRRGELTEALHFHNLAEVIEDALYEFHLPFGSTEGMLVAGICSLAGCRKRAQDRNRSRCR
jgi:hypothetical protein